MYSRVDPGATSDPTSIALWRTTAAPDALVACVAMTDTPLRLEQVFKIGGVPTYTFVEPSEYSRLKVALRTPGRALIVEGPSGTGNPPRWRGHSANLTTMRPFSPPRPETPGHVGDTFEILPHYSRTLGPWWSTISTSLITTREEPSPIS